MKLSFAGGEDLPDALATITSVYRPGRSVCAAEMRPWKETLFSPLWPVKESVPAVTLRLQEGLWRFFVVRAAQCPLAVRPSTLWVKAKLTLACSLSTNEKTVPSGGLFLVLMWGSFTWGWVSRVRFRAMIDRCAQTIRVTRALRRRCG